MNKSKIVVVLVAIFAASICALALAARVDDKQEITELEHKVCYRDHSR